MEVKLNFKSPFHKKYLEFRNEFQNFVTLLNFEETQKPQTKGVWNSGPRGRGIGGIPNCTEFQSSQNTYSYIYIYKIQSSQN